MQSIIVAPSLDSSRNVSGVSAVTTFIIANNESCDYIHFLQGKSDDEKGGLHRVSRILKTYKAWKRMLREHHGAIVHYNFPLDAFSIIRDYPFMRKSVKSGRHTIIHLHGGLFLFKDKKPFLLNMLLKKVFSWDARFIVLSEKEKQRLKDDYNPEEVYVLPNCIDLSIASKFQRTDNPDSMHILYLGRIEPNKGMDYMLEAARKMKEKGEQFVLHFAGIEQKGCNYIDRFQTQLGDQFIYEGVVSGEKKDCLLQLCDVFLLPSFYEGLPMSLLECMSFGMVPVTTNVGSISDFVKDGETGLFIQLRDADGIVDAISRLANDIQLRKSISANAKDIIFRKLQPKEYVRKLNDIYSR
ncbi:MAG: glycosyltransferase family 4 protein [Prevotella sp.]|nr:glycosyltransferase family 4 protein [Prevotella sp.]